MNGDSAHTSPLWTWQIEVLETCPSTNTELKTRFIENRAAVGTVLIAKQQSGGRGRGDRLWHSPIGNLALSACVPEIAKPYHFSLIAGLSLWRTITEITGRDDVRIKWPNDILIGRKKLAGILCEGLTNARCAVIGVGVNVQSRAADFPPDLRDRLTTLADLGMQTPIPTDVATAFLEELRSAILTSESQGFGALLPAIKDALAFRGEHVRLIESDESALTARILDLTEEGLLVIGLPDGSTRNVIAGEIRFL